MNLHARKDKKWSLCSRYLLPSIYLSSNQFSLELLEILGFVDSYLEDDNKSIDSCLLLIFQPSKEIYESEKWTYFITSMSKNIGLIELVEYDVGNRIFGFWMLMRDGERLIYQFKRGKYSLFPEKYIPLLMDREKKVCKKDNEYRIKKEKELGLREGYLLNMELESIPEEKDYKFTLK